MKVSPAAQKTTDGARRSSASFLEHAVTAPRLSIGDIALAGIFDGLWSYRQERSGGSGR